jgi:hypothetical protein
MEQKSHLGPHRAMHKWKITWKDKRVTKFQCCACPLRKIATINYQGGFPNTVYELNGVQFGRAPECTKAVVGA